MFSPFKDHFNLDHDVTASKDFVNLGNLFVILMVGKRAKQKSKNWRKYI